MRVINNHRQTAYALLRITLGVIFLATGAIKFGMGIGVFAGGLQQQFAGKLPMIIVTPFAYLLPFLEVTVGTLLVLGLFNVFALIIAGLLLIGLTFGKVVVNDSATVRYLKELA